MKHDNLLILAVLFLVVAGCDSGPRLLPVSGAVSFEGQPIEEGTIELIPIDGTAGPSTGGAITAGRYEVAAAHGLREGGVYQVRIAALRKTGKTVPNNMQPGSPPVETSENYIPPRFNRNSTLKITATPESIRNGIDFKLP